MLEEDEHVYYWAWSEKDNPDHSEFNGRYVEWYRVFRRTRGVHDTPVTAPMSKAEAVVYCERIVRLTGGKRL